MKVSKNNLYNYYNKVINQIIILKMKQNIIIINIYVYYKVYYKIHSI